MTDEERAKNAEQTTINEMAMSQLKIIAHAISTLYAIKERVKMPDCRNCDNCLLYDCQAFYYEGLEAGIEDLSNLEP